MFLLLVFSVFAFIVIAICIWFLANFFLRRWSNYQTGLADETSRTFDAVFLFLDVHKLRPALILAISSSVLLIIWLTGNWWGLIPAIFCLLLSPKILLLYLRRQRNTRFDKQLPDLLMALSGAVKAGASLQQALQSIIKNSHGPVAEEFGLLLREQRMGLDFNQALIKLNTRMPTEACALVVSALSLSSSTGGSLAGTLENIAITLRARNYWTARVKALTAQGRMQSVVMAILPFLLFFVLHYLEPEAMSLLWSSWYGLLVLLSILLLESIGIFWIHKIANIEV